MLDFMGGIGVIRRRGLATRQVAVVPVDCPVTRVAGRAPKGFEEFWVADRNRLTPDRVALYLGARTGRNASGPEMPVSLATPVPNELKDEIPAMASVRDMPDLVRAA